MEISAISLFCALTLGQFNRILFIILPGPVQARNRQTGFFQITLIEQHKKSFPIGRHTINFTVNYRQTGICLLGINPLGLKILIQCQICSGRCSLRMLRHTCRCHNIHFLAAHQHQVNLFGTLAGILIAVIIKDNLNIRMQLIIFFRRFFILFLMIGLPADKPERYLFA